MDAPDVPRSRSRSRDGSSNKKRFGSSLTSFIKYPHHASGGKRDKSDRNSEPRPSTPSSTKRGDRAHAPSSSVDTSVPVPGPKHGRTGEPHASSSELLSPENEPIVEDFANRPPKQTPFMHGRQTDNVFIEHRPSQPQLTPEPEQPPQTLDFSDSDSASNVHAMSHPESSEQRGAGHSDYPPPGIRVPTRTGSNHHSTSQPTQQTQNLSVGAQPSMPATPDANSSQGNVTYGPGERSSGDSVFSDHTSATSIHTLPPLQSKGPDNSDAQQLEPIGEDDPRSFELVAPPLEGATPGMYAMERRSEQMFSAQHLEEIFAEPKLLMRFTNFLNVHREIGRAHV